MRKMVLFCLAFVAVAFFSGCSGARIANSTAMPQESDKRFLSVKTQCSDGNLNQKLQASINYQLEKQKISLGDDLRLNCEFLDYNEGNRALRYLIGLGAGRATSKASVKLYDKNDMQVGGFEVDAHMTMGVFGGDANSMVDDAAIKIVEYLRKNYILEN